MDQQDRERTGLVEYFTIVKRIVENTGLESFEKVHIVVGSEACDLDSAVCALVYAFHLWKLNENSRTSIVPVLNIPRADYAIKTEVKFALAEQGIDQSALIFADSSAVDPVRLSNLGKLMLTLVDHHVPVGRFVGCERSVCEVIDHHPVRETSQTKFLRNVKLTIEPIGSCATLIAEKLLDFPNQTHSLASPIAFLLYETIVLDTVNFSPAARKATPKDSRIADQLTEFFSTRLLREEIFEKLVVAKGDIAGLTVDQILRKDKTNLEGAFGKMTICSVPILCQDLFDTEGKQQVLEQFSSDHRSKAVVVLGMRLGEKMERDVLIYAPDHSFLSEIVVRLCTPNNDVSLELFRDYAFQPNDIRYQHFRQGNTAASRKQIIPLLTGLLGPTVESPVEFRSQFSEMKTLTEHPDEHQQQVPTLSPGDFGIQEDNYSFSGRSSPLRLIHVGSSGEYLDEDSPGDADYGKLGDDLAGKPGDGQRCGSPIHQQITHLKGEHERMVVDAQNGTAFEQTRGTSPSFRNERPMRVSQCGTDSGMDVVDGNPASIMMHHEPANEETRGMMTTSQITTTKGDDDVVVVSSVSETARKSGDPLESPQLDENAIDQGAKKVPQGETEHSKLQHEQIIVDLDRSASNQQQAGGTSSLFHEKSIAGESQYDTASGSDVVDGNPSGNAGHHEAATAEARSLATAPLDADHTLISSKNTSENTSEATAATNQTEKQWPEHVACCAASFSDTHLENVDLVIDHTLSPSATASCTGAISGTSETAIDPELNGTAAAAIGDTKVGEFHHHTASGLDVVDGNPPMYERIPNEESRPLTAAPPIETKPPSTEWEAHEVNNQIRTAGSDGPFLVPSRGENFGVNSMNGLPAMSSEAGGVFEKLPSDTTSPAGMWLPDGAGKFLTYDSDRDSEPSRTRAPKRMLPMPPLPSQDVAAVVDEHGQPTGTSSDIMVNRQENAIANADFQGTSQGNDTVDGLEPLPVPVTDTVAAPDASDRKPLTPLEKFQLFEAGKSAEKDIKSTGECITGSVNKSEKEQENSGEPKSLPVGDSGSSTTGVATLDNSKSADASVAVPAGSAAVPPRSHKVSTDWETFESIANRNNNLAIPAGCSKSKSESNFKAADGNTMTDPVFKLSTIVPELPRSDSVDKQKTVVVKEGTAGTGVDEVDTGMTVPVPNKANAGNQLTNEVTADQTERPTSPTPDTQVPEWVKNQATWKNNDIDRLDQVEAALSLPDSEMERETATLFMRTWDKEMAKRRTSDEICIAELEGLAKRSVVDNSPQERVAGEPDSHVYPWGSGGVAADKTNEAVEREKVDGPKSESTPGTSTQIPTATSESFPTIPSPATNSDKKVPTTSSPWNGTDTTDGVPSKATPACEAPSTATSSAPGSPGYLAADKSVMLTENEPQAHIPPSDKALAHESKDRNATFLVKQTEAAGVSSDQLCHRVECPVQTPTDSPENEGELVWVRTISATVPADTGNINLSTPHEVGDLPTMRLGPDHVDLPKARTLSENNTKTDGHDETDHGGSLTADGTARTSGTDGDTLSKEEMLTKTTLGGGRNSMNIGGTESSSDLQEGLTLDSDKTTEPSTPSTSDTAVPSEEHLIPATSADGDELLVTHTKSVRLGRTAPNGPKATVDDQRRELFQLSRAQNEANEAKSLGMTKTGQDQIDSSAPYNLNSVAKVEGHSATTEPKLKRQKKTTTTSVDAETSDSDNAALIGSATSSGHGKDSTSFDGDCDSDLSSPTDLRVNPSTATETTPLNPTKAAKLHDKEEETVWAIDMEAMENYKKVLEVHLAQNDSGDKGGATVCFFACYLPARSTPRYEFLMQNIFRYFTSTLDLLADHQCTLIYFNGAVPAAIYPSTSWLHQCYKMIDRRMQKNLQDLIIVHPNFWLKAQLQTIGRAFLSGSFYNKIRYVDRLESLRGSLGMTEGEFERLDVPSCIREDEAKWNTAKAVSDTNTASRFALLRKCSF